MRVEFEKEKFAIIQSGVVDFDNELGNWQRSFFKLLSLKYTFDFIYELKDNKVFYATNDQKSVDNNYI